MAIILSQIPRFNKVDLFDLLYSPSEDTADLFFHELGECHQKLCSRSLSRFGHPRSQHSYLSRNCSKNHKEARENLEKSISHPLSQNNYQCNQKQLQRKSDNEGPWEVVLNYSNFDPKNVKVEVKNSLLTVEGRQESDSGYSFVRHQRTIPEEVSASSLRASFHPDGALKIRQEKPKEEVPTTITITKEEEERPQENRMATNENVVTLEDCDDTDVE